MKYKMLLAGLGCLAACTTPSPTPSDGEGTYNPKIANVVALCSSGGSVTREAQAKLTVELSKIMEGQGSIDANAKIDQAIKGIAFADKDLTNANVVHSQEIYYSCVKENLPNV